jgi:hypothetical protein
MLGYLADVSIRGMVVAAAAGVALLALRNRRSAALEHAVWTAVVCAMLALFVGEGAVPRLAVRVRPATAQSVRVNAVWWIWRRKRHVRGGW